MTKKSKKKSKKKLKKAASRRLERSSDTIGLVDIELSVSDTHRPPRKKGTKKKG